MIHSPNKELPSNLSAFLTQAWGLEVEKLLSPLTSKFSSLMISTWPSITLGLRVLLLSQNH